MTDTPQDAGQTPGATEAAQNQPPRLTILTQYIKDLSFENPNAPVIYAQLKGQPQISVNVDVGVARLQEKLAEVTLRLKVEAKAPEDKVAFLMEMEYGGLCALSGTPSQEETERLYLVEAPAQLFPFARAILANHTRDGGFQPLLLSPIDFGQLYQQRRAKATAAMGAQPGTA